jgi:hypothetical protein
MREKVKRILIYRDLRLNDQVSTEDRSRIMIPRSFLTEDASLIIDFHVILDVFSAWLRLWVSIAASNILKNGMITLDFPRDRVILSHLF